MPSKGGRPSRTRAEVDALVSGCADMLSRGLHKHQVYSWLKARLGIGPSSCQVYVSRARALLRERTGLGLEELRAGSHALYDSVIRDPAATVSQKLQARERIDRLHGLEAPRPRRRPAPPPPPPPGEGPTVVAAREQRTAAELLARRA
jgi:hypothetical protein